MVSQSIGCECLGDVLPRQNSQENKKLNTVGVHWLRVSVDIHCLDQLFEYVSYFFGDGEESEFGLWSYTKSIQWSKGVSLHYDHDINRSASLHAYKMTLECTGSALDTLAPDDLLLFIAGLKEFEPEATRIDIFFDDYNRTITPGEISEIADMGDYSGFGIWALKQKYMKVKGGHGKQQLIHDEINFGVRGSGGSGKYLRVYDKLLETFRKDEVQNCIRWEAEFCGDKAKDVYSKLLLCNDLQQFATLCGGIIAGSIRFVHRTHDKNIKRLELYEFWESILQILGDTVAVRGKHREVPLKDKEKWICYSITPTLACMREIFETDSDFLSWIVGITGEGELRLKQKHHELIKEYLEEFGERSVPIIV